jgi:hypothetical protein
LEQPHGDGGDVDGVIVVFGGGDGGGDGDDGLEFILL